jgi:protein-disulfide isomerase-like protein with CxxC motif
MSSPSFQLTYDYRCPFARNIHEHIVTGLNDGAAWQVEFIPFSLGQSHVEEGGTPVWDDPEAALDLLSAEVSIVVRDRFPDKFLPLHIALFAARHDQSLDLRSTDVLSEILTANGLDATAVLAEVSDGWPKKQFRKEHQKAVDEHQVFGVPTFIDGEDAVFVRVMTRPNGDAQLARKTIDRVVELLETEPDLNEYKHTKVRS